MYKIVTQLCKSFISIKCEFHHPLSLIFTSFKLMSISSTSSHDRGPNRLINERSPYLLQHAYNPVQWYPWGEEAFKKARDESKLIFLSVGYSTCHWCHVMEKESFENDEIAEILNREFVPIKVDREERPDVDRVYMTFVQATSGHGGWPMSVWLTPTLKPYIGGTYFPPDDSMFRRGFKSILKIISEKWKENQQSCTASADKIMDSIQNTQLSLGSLFLQKSSNDMTYNNKAIEIKTDVNSTVPSLESCDKCVEQMSERYDEDMGGFSKAPKFPQPVNLDFLLKYHVCHPNSDKGKKCLDMVMKTLKSMAKGGINDHIGFGFHRYSTDEYWHVPHFEKMLYDQGQLAETYADCYALTKDSSLKETLCEILDYVKRDLLHPSGGFYSAEDADSLPDVLAAKKSEGAFYVWTHEEIRSILSNDIVGNVTVADIVQMYYGVTESGNVSFDQDPHGELRGKNVLIVRLTLEEIAEKTALTVQEVADALAAARIKLFTKREKRPRPHLDNKMITAWNALMISGFSKGALVTGSKEYKNIAVAAAEFVLKHLYVNDEATLLRSCYSGKTGAIEQIEPVIKGFDADYAYSIKAFLDVFELTHDDSWIEFATKLQSKQTSLFWDSENGGFYSVPQGDDSILLRMKEDQDGAEPSANSVSAFNLLRLSAYLDDDDMRFQCEKLLKAFSNRIVSTPFALPSMLSSLPWLWKGFKQIVVQGDVKSKQTQKLMRFINESYVPYKIIIPPEINSPNSYLYRQLEKKLNVLLQSQEGSNDSKVFVCENFTCQLPVGKVEDLKSLL